MQKSIDDYFKGRPSSARGEEQKGTGRVMLPMGFKKYWNEVKKKLHDVTVNASIKNKADFLLLIQWCVVRNYIKNTSERVDLRCLNALLKQLGSTGVAVFLHDLVPFIALAALNIEKEFGNKEFIVPLMSRVPSTLALTRKQITSLLAHCFLCTLPKQKEVHIFHFTGFYSFYSGEFNQLYANKILFLLNYFASVKAINAPEQINKTIKFTRIVLPQSEYDKLTLNYWLSSKSVLRPVVVDTKGKIEDCPDSISVDFANKFLGGGVLEHGAVQEEILFLLLPELLVTRFLCDRLGDNEALLVEGLGQFSAYSGYSSGLRFEGPCAARFDRSVVAIDALPFVTGRDQLMQFHKKPVLRELNKAFIGFNVEKYQERENARKRIATGRWGCGAFKGNAQLKFIIQWLAAAESGKELVFHTYGDSSLDSIPAVVKKYAGKTVGELFAQLVNFDNYFYDSLLKDKSRATIAADVDTFDTLLFTFLLNSP